MILFDDMPFADAFNLHHMPMSGAQELCISIYGRGTKPLARRGRPMHLRMMRSEHNGSSSARDTNVPSASRIIGFDVESHIENLTDDDGVSIHIMDATDETAAPAPIIDDGSRVRSDMAPKGFYALEAVRMSSVPQRTGGRELIACVNAFPRAGIDAVKANDTACGAERLEPDEMPDLRMRPSINDIAF